MPGECCNAPSGQRFFAQFERELTAERIRDKIAASKKKGMWMGGTVPLGYRVENRKLLIDEAAAAEVRQLFSRYLELGSVPALVRELNASGRIAAESPISLLYADTAQGRRRPAKTVGNGKLYYMLSNPIYTGRVRHGGNVYAGEHQSIIDDDIFGAVQTRLAEQAPRERGMPIQRDIHLLNDLLFDETGDRLGPIHATKDRKRCRYYISSRLKAGRSGHKDGWRIPASEIETIVLGQIRELLSNKAMLSGWMQAANHTTHIEAGLTKAGQASVILESTESPLPDMRVIVRTMIRRIDLAGNRIRITIDRNATADWLVGGGSNVSVAADDADLHSIGLQLSIRQRCVERRLVIQGQGASPLRRDQPLIDMIARAHAYLEALTDGQGLGRKDIATRFGVHSEDVSRLLPLAFLSPRIVAAILTGHQPADLTVRRLTRDIELPVAWADQRKLLGI
jgi:hypothetical protein